MSRVGATVSHVGATVSCVGATASSVGAKVSRAGATVSLQIKKKSVVKIEQKNIEKSVVFGGHSSANMH